MRCVIVIPARYASSRFPGKPLAGIMGKPMIRHVYERACESSLSDMVIVATDDVRVFESVEAFGGRALMTSAIHQSGTDRVAEVIKDLQCDVVVNVQGDEPLIRGGIIDDCIRLLEDPRASMGTLKKRIASYREFFDYAVVKVVTNEEGFALYFSRAPIPFYRDHFGAVTHNTAESPVLKELPGLPELIESGIFVYKHLGIYSYRRDLLLELSSLPPSTLESAERLEQLRALENGFKIKVKETTYETIGVDRPEDIWEVEKWLNTYS
ncbi:MAG: 3-deoxy-manno-octulosonate cytidylyltransferase [Nitrospirae bacterium]|nr:3-deoxy-manno-octulosonate cytidylyltransferase [Nitrospirota bacterium]